MEGPTRHPGRTQLHAPRDQQLSGGWPAVVSVALVSFVLVLSEFLPIGLLPDIGGSLHVSTGTTGLLIVVPGLVAAITAPLVTVASGRLDRRWVLIGLAALIAASNTAAAVAPNLIVMVAARVLLGLGVGGFWAMGIGVVPRLVAAHAVHRASSLVTAGISAGTVISLPLGALIGRLAEWRTAFLLATVAGLLTLTALVVLLPALPPTGTVRFATLAASSRHRAVRFALLATALIFFGHFAAYTYITPYLEEHAHFGSSAVTAVLLTYGVAGLVGNFVSGATIGRSLRGVYVTATVLVAAAVGLLTPLADTAPAVVALVALWGAAFGAVPMALQTWIARAARDAPEGGLALLVSASQIALAAGSFLGGAVVDGYGVGTCFALAAVLALFSAATPNRHHR
ncbi:Predicted arabinose efflux permease, MFS family [Streptosporangium subroseum]|uniref:Predicted arabinose efflux permease, MFS family n=1 Tax=Streptosporangium subroseum TaxID=106412 RepID=A0A239BLE0_9ACTN|nr:MFS transporter [Streptosporangium subroseum]SNS07863.1 Predicted arabinose efflux permease, MFS family [Streptosporangium subroseum]